MPAVAAVICDENRYILLQRRSDNGLWGLPGGAIDPGEHPAEALIREVYEETGLSVYPNRVLGVFGGKPNFRKTYPNGDQVEMTVTLFECSVIKGKLRSLDGESLELAFFSLQSLPDSPIITRYELPKIFQTNNHSPHFQWDESWLISDVEH